jgi:tetratricopeptide (TPR) repeat protein
VTELTPNWAEGYRSLAELYLRSNRNLDQARQLMNKAVELQPSAGPYFLLAIARANTNDRAGALEAIQRAVALNPEEKRYQQVLQQLQSAPAP